MIRFAFFAAMACVAAFAGVSWAVRGFPLLVSGFPERGFPASAFEKTVAGPVSGGSMQSTLASTFGGQSAKEYDRKMWEAAHTMRGDDDPKLDKIRMETLQAADAYAMSPCGEITKLNLVTALTAYVSAWKDRMQCSKSGNMVVFCDDKKLKEAAATFSTPLDLRVQAALTKAFHQFGIVKADFPAAIRGDLQHFAGWEFAIYESPLCLPRMRASAGGFR
jgi:hypothetical protein